MPKLDDHLRIRIPATIKQRLIEWADALGVSLSTVVNALLQRGVDERGEDGK